MPTVFVVLDAFPNSLIDDQLTPNLAALAAEGGRNPAGGVAEATAATYPNHATFATGVSTLEHGIITNNVLRDGKWIPSAKVGPDAPTLFEACRSEGRSSALLVGDQNLVGVCGGEMADVHWPPEGVIPDAVARSEGGYIADDAVIDALARLDPTAFDLLFLQLDEVDGARHKYGAWGDEARKQCHRTDAALGRVIDLLRPVWEDTVMMVVSDHDQEDVGPSVPVDFRRELPPGVMVSYQGTAALIVGEVGPADLRNLPGVTGSTSLDAGNHVVWGAPGQVFGSGYGTGGDHGSPRTTTQVAVVGGGSPKVADLKTRVEASRPTATAWAGWMAEAIGLRWRPGQDLAVVGANPEADRS